VAAIDELISTYLTACEVEGKTANTVTAYRATLRDFRRVGERLGLPDAVESYVVPDVYAYLAELRERGASAAYQHRRHREVKAYFSWCRRMGLIEENVFARVPLVRLEQKIVEPFSQAEITALLGSQDRGRHTGCRNYALVLFLLDTGVRASECVGTRLDDVDWEGRRVRILHGKGKKQRWVGFGERTEQSLRDYIERFRGDEGGQLFRTAKGEPFAGPHTLNVILQRIAERMELRKVHPHRFRHTFATWAIRASAREIDVQSLLGHSSLAMVQRYARTYSSEQAVAAHASFSPVGQLSA
jgi:integrase/recombinase XerD